MNEEHVLYSIQQTYIIKPIYKSEKRILTCDERIYIPTIEPLTKKARVYQDEYQEEFLKIIPCVELAGNFLSEFNLEFETNEGVTVLPIKLDSTQNPYVSSGYVLVLPRGTTGVKSCKLIHKATGEEFQHNFTFGIMPSPYNYDNALFSYIYFWAFGNTQYIRYLDEKVTNLTARVTALENKAGG